MTYGMNALKLPCMCTVSFQEFLWFIFMWTVIYWTCAHTHTHTHFLSLAHPKPQLQNFHLNQIKSKRSNCKLSTRERNTRTKELLAYLKSLRGYLPLVWRTFIGTWFLCRLTLVYESLIAGSSKTMHLLMLWAVSILLQMSQLGTLSANQDLGMLYIVPITPFVSMY